MTPEERQMLSGLFDRIRGASNGPRDQEAESFINDAVRSTPSAAYVMAQTVLVQQQALEAATRRIQDLEAQARSGGGAPPQGGGSFLGNLGRSLFGGDPQPQQPPPRPGYDARSYERPPEPPPGYGQRPAYAPPPPQAGPWGAPPQAAPQAAPQGGGFLHGALQTATGVAGGVLLGNAIGGLFGGHGGGMFGGGMGNTGFGGGGFGMPHETVNETVNNYYETDPGRQGGQNLLDAGSGQDDQVADYDDGGGDVGGDDVGGGDDWA